MTITRQKLNALRKVHEIEFVCLVAKPFCASEPVYACYSDNTAQKSYHVLALQKETGSKMIMPGFYK